MSRGFRGLRLVDAAAVLGDLAGARRVDQALLAARTPFERVLERFAALLLRLI